MKRRNGSGGKAGVSLGRTLAQRRRPVAANGRSNGEVVAATSSGARTNGSGLGLLPVIGLASDHPCIDCAQCCKYVAIEIDAPTTMTEYDYLVWYLVHPGISVFVDWNGSWFVKFESRCQNLEPNGMCGIYETRPAICRDFDWKECEQHLRDEPADKWLFRSAEEFTTWLEKQRPKAYQKFRVFQREHRRKKTPKELRRLERRELPSPPA